MRILLFCSNPVNGGTAQIFYELAKAMGEMLPKTDQLTVCVNENNPAEIYKSIKCVKRIPVYSEEEICSGMYGGGIVKRLWNRFCRKLRYAPIKKRNIAVMQRFLRDSCIETVIIHNGGYVGDDLCNQMLTAAYCCAEHTFQRIYVLHSDMEKDICLKLRFWAYDKKISREATDIVTVSEFTRKRMLSSSFISRDIKVIHNGISETHRLTEAEKQSAISVSPEKMNVLMIGNFQENKGQYQFLEAAYELCKCSESYHFTIIGNVYDEEYYRKCLTFIERNRLEQKISILQGIYCASELISLFELLVVPSMYDESFGLISVEAMANRRPVVAFACGGIPEVVSDGRTGIVVPVGDVKSLAERIEWLAGSLEQRRAMGEQGRMDYEERFTVEAMAQGYLGLIRRDSKI